MNKEDKLNKLFDEWRKLKKKDCSDQFKEPKTRGQFIPDGIVCFDTYEKENLKVLFVLKETNDEDPEKTYPRGMCDEIKESTSGNQIWNRILEWSRALTDGSSELISHYELRKKANGEEYFNRIALMNIKKSSGDSGVDSKEFKEYFENEKNIKYAREEIEIIDPDVVIACSTDVYKVLDEKVFCDIKKTNRGKLNLEYDNRVGECYGEYFDISEFLGRDKPVFVFAVRHPANHCSAEPSYNDMLKIRQFILETQTIINNDK